MKDGLNNKQFIVITLVIMLCGIAIFGRDYVQTKKTHAVENITLAFEEDTGPEVMESVEETNTESTQENQDNLGLDQGSNETTSTQQQEPQQNTSSNTSQVAGDTSGRITKKKTSKSKYIGRIKIPSIGLNRGFVQAPSGSKGLKCVDQNVCVYSGDGNYPNRDGTHLILGAHNGSGWNAYFTRIDQLNNGAKAYIEYKGKRYKYQMVDSYKDAKGDYAISFRSNGENKQLSLFTCARPNYNRYYLVLSFKLISEEKL